MAETEVNPEATPAGDGKQVTQEKAVVAASDPAHASDGGANGSAVVSGEDGAGPVAPEPVPGPSGESAPLPAIAVPQTGEEMRELILTTVREEFAEWEASERDRLIQQLTDRMRELQDWSEASGSKSKRKPLFSSGDFLSTASVFVENIISETDLLAKRNYAVDFLAEMKELVREERHKQEKTQRMKQELADIKAKNEKLPAHLTKKGYAKLMEQKKQHKKELQRLHKRANRCDMSEVDFSLPDEELDNSKFLQRDKIAKRILFLQKKIREIDGAPEVRVPRPLCRRFRFGARSPSGDAALDTVVADFMTKRLRGMLFDSPDFTDLLTVVKEQRPHLAAAELHQLTQQLFVAVCRELKQRRNYETMDFLHGYESDEDQAEFKLPEDDDADLKARLAENDKTKKDESVVLEVFAKKWEAMTAEEQQKESEVVTDSEKDPDEEEEEGEEHDDSEVESHNSADDDDSSSDDESDGGDDADGEAVSEADPAVLSNSTSEVCPLTPVLSAGPAVPLTPVLSAKPAVPLTPPPSQQSQSSSVGNGISNKRNSPNALPGVQSITIDDDSDEELPTKKMRLQEPGSSKQVTGLCPQNNVSDPAGPMDWKPADKIPDVVDLSSDDD